MLIGNPPEIIGRRRVVTMLLKHTFEVSQPSSAGLNPLLRCSFLVLSTLQKFVASLSSFISVISSALVHSGPQPAATHRDYIL